jgi:hypothetical protein
MTRNASADCRFFSERPSQCKIDLDFVTMRSPLLFVDWQPLLLKAMRHVCVSTVPPLFIDAGTERPVPEVARRSRFDSPRLIRRSIFVRTKSVQMRRMRAAVALSVRRDADNGDRGSAR